MHLCYRESYGYISQKWKDPPSDDSKFTRKRAMQLTVTLQCGRYSSEQLELCLSIKGEGDIVLVWL